jgi:hypothetical protein
VAAAEALRLSAALEQTKLGGGARCRQLGEAIRLELGQLAIDLESGVPSRQTAA